ncbi:MAG: lipopolysaccharide transport periplasmic protein LptA [Neisseria sp.]|nr:lipopolysaccharide transport periplasmic protein LptA [Neisseria sp.]
MFRNPINLSTLLLLALSAPLFAAEADRNQPVHIEADNASFAKSNEETEFTGDVVVVQGSLNIRADKVNATRNQQTGGQYIVATGKPVHFRQDMDEKRPDGKPQVVKGHADQATFDSLKNTVVLTGNAFIDREGDTVTGPQIVYNTQTAVYTVNGKPEGAKSGRVSVVLQPATVGGQNNAGKK